MDLRRLFAYCCTSLAARPPLKTRRLIAKIFGKSVFRSRAIVRRFVFGYWRTLYWRSLGASIGRGTILPQLEITWPHQLKIGKACVIEPGCYFKYDGIWKDGPTIIFGDNVFVGTHCEFNIQSGLVIGSNSLIASGCRFIDHDHSFARRDVLIRIQESDRGTAIQIGEDVWIGANVVVLKGVTIGSGAIVAAGSVVTKAIGPFEIWAGVPARKLSERPY